MATHPTDRLPPLPPETWSEAQRYEVRAIVDGPRGALLPPFVPLMRSPELLGLVQRLGEYVRFRNSLGPRLTEVAVLVTAHRWSQPVEWALHVPIATRAGVAASAIDAIGAGRRPEALAEDELLVHDFCVELQRDHAVTDATWDAAVARFGERGAVDLVGICGHYTLLAMLMNAARTPVPDVRRTRGPVR